MRERITDPKHNRRCGLGKLALSWITHFCIHGPGDIQGAPLDPSLPGAVPLDEEFAGMVVDFYTTDTTGSRLYKQAHISRAKGRAKSELAGFLALFEAFGPCRVQKDDSGLPILAKGGETYTMGEFVYTYSPGEFMARHITYPFIRCLATEEEQAGNTYDNVYVNVNQGPRFKVFNLGANDVGVTRIILSCFDGGGEIRPSSASGNAKDGGKETFVVFDEVHLYYTAELKRMYGTVTRNMEKRMAAEPWWLTTTTMFQPGQESIGELSYKTAKLIAEDEILTTGVFYDHRQADDDTDVNDRESLRKGIIEALGPAHKWRDIEGIINSFFDITNQIADQRRYFLNQPTSAENAWLIERDWNLCPGPLEVKKGEEVALGFDGSEKSSIPGRIADATALMGCRISDGYLFVIKVWEQSQTESTWAVDVEDVDYEVTKAFRDYKVVAFYADPAKWEATVSSWERKYGRKLKHKAGNSGAIKWWMNKTTLWSRALDEFESQVRDHNLPHDHSELLTRHALNARRRPRQGGMQISKEHNQSPHKIDAIVAGVLAFTARNQHLAVAPRRITRVVGAVPR